MVTISDFRANQYPVVDGLRCVNVWIPDDDAFMPLLAGLLYLPTRAFNYTGADLATRAAIAQTWVNAYAANDWMDCMDCEQVAECIASNEATQEALNQWFIDALNNPDTGVYEALKNGGLMSPDDADRNLTGTNDDCNLDALWGFIDGGIEGMNANNIDAQQSLEAVTNIFERAATVVSAIPGIGVLPVDEVIAYINGLWSNDLFENYEANDTTGYRNELKCDIFCLAQANDCKVTVDMLFTYFQERLSYEGDDIVDDIVQFLIDGTWSGTQINDTFYLAQLLWMRNGNRFFPVQGIMSFSTLFALGEPSDDWELLCEECVTEWDFVINFETGENVEFVTITNGDYETGVGVHQAFTQSGNGYETINLLWTPSALSHLTHYEIDADYSAGELASSGDATLYFQWGSTPETLIITPTEPTFPYTWDGDADGYGGGGTGVQIMPGVHIGTGDPGGTALLRSITLHGTGNPPELP